MIKKILRKDMKKIMECSLSLIFFLYLCGCIFFNKLTIILL